jgi:hypothetical protein
MVVVSSAEEMLSLWSVQRLEDGTPSMERPFRRLAIYSETNIHKNRTELMTTMFS